MANDVQFNATAFNRFLTRIVQPYLMRKAEQIAEEARGRAPVGGTGDLVRSIHVERLAGGGATVKVDAPHAGFVHQGTGAGHIPDPRPSYYPKLRHRGLILWSDAKGVNPYQVAHGISRKGTPANPFLAESIENVLHQFRFRWINRDLTT